MLKVGFNALYEGHRITEGRIAPLKPGVFRIGILDSDPNYWVVTDLVQRLGLRPLVCIYGHHPEPARHASIAREMVSRFPNVILQSLNEPNSPDYGAVEPQRVAAVTMAIFEAVPEGTGVYGPAMNPLDGWEDYMDKAYMGVSVQVKPSLHLYPRKEINKTVDHAFSVAREIGGTPQVTECGCPRDSWAKQADATKRLYRRIKERGAGTCIFHTAAELASMNEWDRRARLWFLRADGSRTGLYDAIQAERS